MKSPMSLKAMVFAALQVSQVVEFKGSNRCSLATQPVLPLSSFVRMNPCSWHFTEVAPLLLVLCPCTARNYSILNMIMSEKMPLVVDGVPICIYVYVWTWDKMNWNESELGMFNHVHVYFPLRWFCPGWPQLNLSSLSETFLGELHLVSTKRESSALALIQHALFSLPKKRVGKTRNVTVTCHMHSHIFTCSLVNYVWNYVRFLHPFPTKSASADLTGTDSVGMTIQLIPGFHRWIAQQKRNILVRDFKVESFKTKLELMENRHQQSSLLKRQRLKDVKSDMFGLKKWGTVVKRHGIILSLKNTARNSVS